MFDWLLNNPLRLDLKKIYILPLAKPYLQQFLEAAFQFWNFIKILPQHGCSPVNFQHIFRIFFLRAPQDDFLRILTKFALCTATIISGVVSDVFWGKILFAVLVVHYQTSYLKILAMMLTKKQMLIFLRQNTQNHACFPKARGIKQSITIRSNGTFI